MNPASQQKVNICFRGAAIGTNSCREKTLISPAFSPRCESSKMVQGAWSHSTNLGVGGSTPSGRTIKISYLGTFSAPCCPKKSTKSQHQVNKSQHTLVGSGNAQSNAQSAPCPAHRTPVLFPLFPLFPLTPVNGESKGESGLGHTNPATKGVGALKSQPRRLSRHKRRALFRSMKLSKDIERNPNGRVTEIIFRYSHSRHLS